MNQELLLSWRPRPLFLSPKPLSRTPILPFSVRATLSTPSSLKEKRQLRNERREQNTSNWREEIQDKLLTSRRKSYKAIITEDLDLCKMAELGPQWWMVKVPRGGVTSRQTADRIANALATNFPDVEFKLYAPAVHMKRKLKSGAISVKSKPVVPGFVFLNCVMNKEVHDAVKQCEGYRGFVGPQIGSTVKRNLAIKPTPVPPEEMERVFRKAKEEQKKSDEAFEEAHPSEGVVELEVPKKIVGITEAKKRIRKASGSLENDFYKLLPGSNVRILSGPFAEFSGSVKKLDSKRRLATVGFSLFGKETSVDLDFSEIVAEPK